MSLSLVAYSDGESSSDETENTSEPPKDPPLKKLKSLPDHNNKFASSLTDLVVKKDAKGGIKIVVPTVADFDDVDTEEEEERKRKRQKLLQSSSGSSLLSCLPKPQARVVKATTLSFTPHSVKVAAAKVVPNAVKADVSSENDEDNPVEFFPLKSTLNDEKSVVDDAEPEPEAVPESAESSGSFSKTVDIAPSVIEDALEVLKNPYAQPVGLSTDHIDINDHSYKAFVAQKFGEEPPEAINIVDVNIAQHVRANKEYLKTISQEKPEEFKGLEPTAAARRKHQITYLAYQAKQRELSLKNEWATSKLTKSQTRAKYGF